MPITWTHFEIGLRIEAHGILIKFPLTCRHFLMSCSPIYVEQASSIHLRNKKVLYFWTSGQTREPIVSTFMLIWRISINDPLNEPLLYSSWLIWRILWRGRTKVRWSAVQRTGTKRPLWRFQMHSCQIHKRRAIFRLIAINTSGKPQHSANLDFNESKASPFALQRAAPLSYSHLAHAWLGDIP